MCGFVSVINCQINKENINKKFYSLKNIYKHRGPDDIRTLSRKNYTVLFRRLKIIDLSNKANQPYSILNGKISMVFNGEIYNYLEVKKELKEYGYKFLSNSDTEVLIKSYLHWGLNFISKIRGMFSIIIFDEIKNKILFFRDHLGQKPLFYSKLDDGYVLSSEIKDILYFKKNVSENQNIVKKYLARGWCDDGKYTFFNNIFSLMPGSYGVIYKNKISIKKYWKLNINKKKKYIPEEFSENFKNNINLHLRSDVPIAFTLSGGLDSSSLLKSAMDQQSIKYKAFSLKTNFKEEDDEKKYIDKFVYKLNANHNYLNINKNYNKNILEELLRFHDEPVNSVSCINQFLLRKQIKKEGYKVLVVGEGGDEVLAGYNRMFLPYLYNNYIKPNKKIPKILKENISRALGKNFSVILKNIKSHYLELKKNKHDIEDLSCFKFLNFKINDLPKNLKFYNSSTPSNENYFKSFMSSHLLKRDLPHTLRMEDRNSMSQSIENRSPFVDYKFIEYIYSLDEYYFMKDGLSKYMLRNFMNNKLPKIYFTKKKVGRPGDAKILIFKHYFEKFCDYLSMSQNKNQYFDTKSILDNINSENKNQNFSKDNRFYFRVLNYIIWKNSILNGLNNRNI